jgi:hypothetical protein
MDDITKVLLAWLIRVAIWQLEDTEFVSFVGHFTTKISYQLIHLDMNGYAIH